MSAKSCPPHAVAERRVSPRHEAVERLAMLVWKEGRRHRIAYTFLWDISRGGAALAGRGPCPKGGPVWMTLLASGPIECAAATPVELVADGRGGWLLRLAFDGPCPPALYQAATRGLESLTAILN